MTAEEYKECSEDVVARRVPCESHPFLCRIGWHRWTGWRLVGPIEMTSFIILPNGAKVDTVVRKGVKQRRHCLCCGKLEFTIAILK